eukprot:CAMPEP_0172478276 /NCGR_PEP_ID=MMETSP1066-20121228/2119_1 /TAXON_ID=671091 /ORGANISM="Coscinodiscus wailesii, Strain CCMP2513" /LENGTH=493 /DNA_ID=CAMNT_0013237701 /DNA_START=87 /DNA_END=1568 /DNA_ORIENTATION=-
MKDITAIVAASAASRGIGRKGTLPWHLPADMSHFKKLTSTPPQPHLTNAVIMGRKTWDSIPSSFRPLSNRTNVVLTSQPPSRFAAEGCTIVANSFDEALTQLRALKNVGKVYVIGGGSVYEAALGVCDAVCVTEVRGLSEEVEGEMDAFFPILEESVWERKEVGEWKMDGKSGLEYRFLEMVRRTEEDEPGREEKKEVNVAEVNPEEMQYLDLCRDIIRNGVKRGDRTGTGTLSTFGAQMRFSLRDGTLPLLTTKQTFWRGVAEELLWFISGSTNANLLAEKNIHIWDGNGSREFLDSRGLGHREEGDLGPVYGFQWRHFGAEYVDMHTDYRGKGVDQLAECIRKIKESPEDRRIIMSAWNPADLNIMALPPCHMFCQFYVDTTNNELSCQMYQRSADMGLGVPFNIASYALLTHLIAHVTGRKPGDFVHVIGDAHVYLNHVEALEQQLTRLPRAFPKLLIKGDKKDIDDFCYEDFEVVGYCPHKRIKMKMAV